MPRMNGTGPMGQGPRTGRGLGNCAGAVQNNQRGFGLGRGFGRGQGFGFGMGASDSNFKVLSKGDQIKALELEKKAIEKEISDLNA